MKATTTIESILNDDKKFIDRFTKDHLAFLQEYLSKYCLLVQFLYFVDNKKHYTYEKRVYNEDHNPHHALFIITGIYHVGLQTYFGTPIEHKRKILELLLDYEERALIMFNKGSFKRNPKYNVSEIPLPLLAIKEVEDALEEGRKVAATRANNKQPVATS